MVRSSVGPLRAYGASHREAIKEDGVVAEGHPQLADGVVDVGAEVVGEAQHLVAEVEHGRVAEVLPQDPLSAGS